MSETEEEQEAAPRGKPNAYFAEKDRALTFTGSYRAVKPVPHGGQQTVKEEDTIGLEDACWCGQPAGHSWPGKSGGAPHPRRGTEMTNSINRRDLRAYHATLQAFVMHAVNNENLSYRMQKNAILIYPPDGSAPLKVHARNTDRQFRDIAKWWEQHVGELDLSKEGQKAAKREAAEVAVTDVVALAEKLNGPEHEVPEPAKVEVKVEPKVEAPKPAPPKPAPPKVALPKIEQVAAEQAAEVKQEAEWVPVPPPKTPPRADRNPSSVDYSVFETNGEQVRCKVHLGTEHEWIGTKAGMTGHWRTRHMETESLWGSEATAKKVDTAKARRIAAKVNEAITMLASIIDYDPLQEIEQLKRDLAAAIKRAEKAEAALEKGSSKEVAALKKENETLRKEADDAKARLALIQEAMKV
jgi:hypothetical protein